MAKHEDGFRCARARRLAAAAACLLGSTLGAPGAAQAPAIAPLPLEGDAARGKTLAYTCTGCHGVPGYRNAYPSFHVPKLGGQNADYVEIALQSYRSGRRPHATMQAQAAALSDQDIADIAAYLAGIEGEPAAGISAANAALVRAGRQRSTACVPCHGNDGSAASPQWPHLAGQHASYLRHSLEEYRSGARADAVMEPMVATLEETALAELAAFYAAQAGLYLAAP